MVEVKDNVVKSLKENIFRSAEKGYEDFNLMDDKFDIKVDVDQENVKVAFNSNRLEFPFLLMEESLYSRRRDYCLELEKELTESIFAGTEKYKVVEGKNNYVHVSDKNLMLYTFGIRNDDKYRPKLHVRGVIYLTVR